MDIALTPRQCLERFSAIREMVGNTPLLEISFRFRGQHRRLYAKAEHLNLTGSIKDRMALHIMESAYRSGAVQPGDTIAEATSGNTGIGLAFVFAIYQLARFFGLVTLYAMLDTLLASAVLIIDSTTQGRSPEISRRRVRWALS